MPGALFVAHLMTNERIKMSRYYAEHLFTFTHIHVTKFRAQDERVHQFCHVMVSVVLNEPKDKLRHVQVSRTEAGVHFMPVNQS